jgi:hypothetical protein
MIRIRERRTVLAAALMLAVIAGACGGSEPVVAGPGDLGHVHDLVLTEDGTLLVAAHSGLYRIETAERAVRVWDEYHDLMAMAATDNGNLVASGHPSLQLDQYRIEGRPPHLGFIESNTGGSSWVIGPLLGEADFHAFAPTAEGVYGAESSGSIWFRDNDREWSVRGDLEARDLATQPDDARVVVGTGYDDSVYVSRDGADTWVPLDDAPALIEIEWPAVGALWGVDIDGLVWTTEELGNPWLTVGQVGGEPETLMVDSSATLWVSLHGGSILRSDDLAESWRDVYSPPADE